MATHFIMSVTCQRIIKIIYMGSHYTHSAKNRRRVFIFMLIVEDFVSRERLIAIISN